jgi:uncharacterized protein (TIGR03435 family)
MVRRFASHIVIAAVAAAMLVSSWPGEARVRAQAPAADAKPQAFEVASVKPSDPNPSSPLGAIPMVMPPVGGRLTAKNVPLRILVRLAYELQDFQIVGSQPVLTDKFDITAKAPDGFTGSAKDMAPMVKALLADRFKLKVHTETRELPIHELVVARSDRKLGPDLKPSSSVCPDPEEQNAKRAEALAKGGLQALASMMPKPGEALVCGIAPAMDAGGFGLRANGQPLTIVVSLLSQVTGRVVKDKTELTGLYDWQLKFDPEVLLRLASAAGINVPAGAASQLPQSDSPSLMTALQEQLGLKLQNAKGPVDVLVIDSVEAPQPD